MVARRGRTGKSGVAPGQQGSTMPPSVLQGGTQILKSQILKDQYTITANIPMNPTVPLLWFTRSAIFAAELLLIRLLPLRRSSIDC